jgi:hypothetical protein
MGADWYRVTAWLRDSWSIARDLRDLHRKSPATIVWLMPMTHTHLGYFPETSKPGLPDWQLTREELRLHFWSGIALGVKGFVPYKVLSRPFGLRNGKALVNPLLRPEEPARLLEEMGQLGRDAVTIGPLLLSCRPDVSFKIRIHAGRVSFPAFQGPAVDLGVLKDIKHDRYFLIPWNNDIRQHQSANITLPEMHLAGRHVYNMHTFERFDLDREGRLHVDLAPGGGQIFLLANAEEFADSRQTVLRHRAERDRITAWKRLRIARAQQLDVAAADRLMLQAGDAAKKGNWSAASTFYRQVPAEVDQAEDRFKPAGQPELNSIKQVRAAFGRVAEHLSTTNMQVNTHHRPFGIDLAKTFSQTASPNKYVGPALDEWMEFTRRYYKLQERFRSGRFWDIGTNENSSAELLSLEKRARHNVRAVKQAIEGRLNELRKDIRVALLTPDRSDPQSCQLYSFAYENCHVRWFVPDGENELCDRQSKQFIPEQFDVVWYHQDRLLGEMKNESPDKVLMPELIDTPLLGKMQHFVTESGGGLLLTGIAGLYTLPLEIESIPADHIRQNTPMHKALVFNLLPARGFATHPIYSGFAEDAMPANAVYGWTPLSVVCEYAWENSKPTGQVIARQTDNGLDAAGRRKLTGFDVEAARYRSDSYAPVVKYHPGKGKVLVLGGLSVHMMPGGWRGKPRSSVIHRRRIRKFTLNALTYLASPTQFEPPTGE